MGGALRNQQSHDHKQNFHLSARYLEFCAQTGRIRQAQVSTRANALCKCACDRCISREKWAGLVLLCHVLTVT